MEQDDFHRPVTKRKSFDSTVGTGTVDGTSDELRDLYAETKRLSVAGRPKRKQPSWSEALLGEDLLEINLHDFLFGNDLDGSFDLVRMSE
jgi:hypothetical protein